MQLEQKLNEVEQFYAIANRKQQSASTPKGSSVLKDKDKEKQVASFKKRQLDAARREAAAAKRMQELMRQFGTILRQVVKVYLHVFFLLDNIAGSSFILVIADFFVIIFFFKKKFRESMIYFLGVFESCSCNFC